MAPELLYENEQSTAVDIWAIGVIIFELTTKKLPFTAKTTPKIYENIKVEGLLYRTLNTRSQCVLRENKISSTY